MGLAEATAATKALVLAGMALVGAEAAFFHGRVRFFHPAMWTPAAYAILVLGFGIPHLLDPADPLTQLGYYYLLWVGLAAGVAGHLFHLRRAARLIRSIGKDYYRRLAAGPPLLLPLALSLFSLLGLVAFHIR